MPTTIKPVSFTLGDRDRSSISDMVKKGRFGNRTEVVRAGLRLILTDTARADLAEIYDHIKQDSPAAAKALVTDPT
jgi:putative addiction module CopG family antidote